MHFREIADTKRLLVLILVMVGVAASSAGLGGWGLYRAALDEQRNWLYDLVKTQARMIEAVARFDAQFSQHDHPDGANFATINQMLDAYNRSEGFGQSGEFVLGRLDGGLIVFLDTGRRSGAGAPGPVSVDSNMAEPMRRALQGHSGTMIGTDYRGVRVLAAYEPVAVLNVGLVAKIDMSEVRAPFIRVAIMGGLGALFIIILGGVLTHRISAPFVGDLKLQAQMLKNMSEGVLLIRSEDAMIVFANPKFEVMFGYDPGELIGKNVSVVNAVSAVSSEQAASVILSALKEKGSWAGEVLNVHKDGTPFWCHASVSAFKHPQFGEVWVSAHEDISERKKVEAALKQSEQRFRAIADYTYDWEIWLGDDGDVKWVNPAVERMTGYRVSECLAMANFPLEIVHQDDWAALSEHRTQALYQGMENEIDFRVRCKNGTLLWASFSYQPIFDDDDVFLGSRWSIRDISARKRLESDLRHAKSDAEKANRAKSDFLAGMSHDLRTPLNAIMGFSDMMRSKTFGPLGDAHYDGYADDIYNSGALLISLINDILDLSKVEAGKYDLAEESLQVAALVDACTHQVEKMAQDAGLKVSTTMASDLPKLCGDKKVVTQILNNLLSNAIKFTPVGGRVAVAAKLDEEGAIVMSVSDEGIGMSPEDITRAMQPFEQVDGGDNSRKHEGTGLGLPLCANFMALHDGEIDVQSEVGKGTTVTVHFPAERTIVN